MDVRLQGFAERTPLAAARAWLDAVSALSAERVPSATAHRRVLAASVAAPADFPDRARSACNGFAVHADETEGASPYNPIAPSNGLQLVATGAALPDGADAVLEFDHVESAEVVIAEVAPGNSVTQRGEQIRAGAEALPAGRRLRAQDVALLALMGIADVSVVRAPLVRVSVAGPKHGADALTALLCLLLAESGAVAAASGDADLIVVAGRGGSGADDDAPERLAAQGGRLDLHGIALRPGGSSGLGWLGSTPLLLLPGEPLACLAAFSVLAAPLLRRMGGLPDPAPVNAILRRKIVSGIGVADFARVRLDGGFADPLGAIETAGLPGAARADGYVLVPAESEGFAPGASVAVHLFEQAQ